ncbi:unnamed protein product [Paramecium sonneborni]|uniref:Uncharacterized protein n=1 Tax=Paramecium sonneborni TaxID=65129 RepID=A0A8S1R5W6_9CILI|nr:unnamed protein product [Paramecium sonneborni]
MVINEKSPKEEKLQEKQILVQITKLLKYSQFQQLDLVMNIFQNQSQEDYLNNIISRDQNNNIYKNDNQQSRRQSIIATN